MKRLGIFSIGMATLFLMQQAAYGQAGWPQGYYGQAGYGQPYYGYGQPAPQQYYPNPYYQNRWPQGYYQPTYQPPPYRQAQYYPPMTPAPMTPAYVRPAQMTVAPLTPAQMTAASDLNSMRSASVATDRDASSSFQMHEVSKPLPQRVDAGQSIPTVEVSAGPPGPACGPACGEGTGACCAGPEGCCAAPPVQKPCEHHCGFFVDYLLLTPRGTAVNYAQERSGVTALSVPRGPLGSVEPDYQSGYRVGMTYDLDATASLQLTYSWFEASNHDQILATGSNVLLPLTLFPATLNSAITPLSATAVSKVDFMLGDIDYKDCLFNTRNGSVRYLLGARYARLDQKFNADYSILGRTAVTTDVKFDGGGPRIGLEGERHFCHGFLIYGRGVASFLAGRFRGDYDQVSSTAGDQANTHYHSDRIVPVLDMELGLGWTSPKGKFRVTGGYLLSGWFNAVTTPDFIQGVQNTNFTTNGSNLRDILTFDGLTARVEYRF